VTRPMQQRIIRGSQNPLISFSLKIDLKDVESAKTRWMLPAFLMISYSEGTTTPGSVKDSHHGRPVRIM